MQPRRKEAVMLGGCCCQYSQPRPRVLCEYGVNRLRHMVVTVFGLELVPHRRDAHNLPKLNRADVHYVRACGDPSGN